MPTTMALSTIASRPIGLRDHMIVLADRLTMHIRFLSGNPSAEPEIRLSRVHKQMLQQAKDQSDAIRDASGTPIGSLAFRQRLTWLEVHAKPPPCASRLPHACSFGSKFGTIHSTLSRLPTLPQSGQRLTPRMDSCKGIHAKASMLDLEFPIPAS